MMNTMVDKLITVMKDTIEKEEALGKVFGTNTNVYEETLYGIQRVIYEAVEFNENEIDKIGSYKEGLFNQVIDDELTIWDLKKYLQELSVIWSRYVNKEIDLDAYYGEEYSLNIKYNLL